jgi:hypothetical protein
MRLHLSILSACLASWVASGPAAAQPASSPPDPGSVDAKDRAGKSDRDRDAKARPRINFKPATPPSVGGDAPGGADNALPSMGATPGTPSGSFGGSTPGRVKDPK